MWKNFKADVKYKLSNEKVEHPVRYKFMKWLLILLVIILVLLLILFILIFIVFPLVFMFSVGLEAAIIFMNMDVPKNPEFNNPTKYGYKGVTNFYITSTEKMDNLDLLSLGAWFLPQETYINSTETMDEILSKNEHPILLYNHGVLATRILMNDYMYATLRKSFHVVAIDYRGYGDSTSLLLTEDGVVTDVVHTYNLVKKKTKADIYVWGHSLGGGVTGSFVKWLKENQGETVAGFIIESSFTCLEDEVTEFGLAKYFTWLPWFRWCVVNPIRNHGYIFNTTGNAQYSDSPIMIMHAGDDPVIPFYLGEKNYHHINESRKPGQGKVFFHPFPASKGYGHVGCTQDPAVPKYIEDFIDECKKWKRTHLGN